MNPIKDKNMSSTELCPVCCEGHLVTSEKVVPLKSGSHMIDVEQHTHVCDLCGTAMATAEDLKFNARAFRAADQHASGRMNGYDIKALRKRFKISHKAAGQIFGGGPVAFCKYENHEIAPTDAMDNLLWVACRYPVVAEALAARHGVPLSVSPTAIPDVSVAISTYHRAIVREHSISPISLPNNVYKMWENSPIIIANSQASNEITLNYDSAIAA